MAFFRISELPAGAVPVPVTALLEIASVKGGEVSGYESNRVTVSELFTDVSFVGLPIAPTAPPGTSTNQVATTAFVTEAVSAGVANAPYVHRAGDTMSGGLIAPRIDVTGDLTASHIFVVGSSAAMFLEDRTLGPGEPWTLYAESNQFHLYTDGAIRFSVSDVGDTAIGKNLSVPAGGIFAGGNVTAAGIVASGNVTAGGDLIALGNYLRLAGAGGAVNTTGGPLLYADGATWVTKLGPGVNGYWIQDYNGNIVVKVTPAGELTAAGALHVGNNPNPSLALFEGTKWTALYAPDNTAAGHACIAVGGAASGGNTIHRNSGHYFYNIDGSAPYASLDNSTANFYKLVNVNVSDGVQIAAPSGGSARVMHLVTGQRLWSAGVLSSGSYAIADESGAMARLTIGMEGTSIFNGRIVLQKNTNIGESGIALVSPAGIAAFVQTTVSGGRTHYVGTLATTGAWYMHDATANADRMLVFPTGECANQGGEWLAFSDASLKQNVEPYQRGLEAIRNLSPVSYQYQAGTPFTSEDEPSRTLYGLIADDVSPYMPEACGEQEIMRDGEPVTVGTIKTGTLTYALINAAKELAAKVDGLEVRLAALEE